MFEQEMESLIGEVLVGDAQKNAMEFIAYLRAGGMAFEKAKDGYWKDKPYWHVTYKDEYVCFVFIHGYPAKYIDEPEGWMVWSDTSDTGVSQWYETALSDGRMEEIALKNVDFCGKCSPDSPCYGGMRKTIFGKGFDHVCRTTFRFDNPDAETVECLKKLVEVR